MKTTCMDRINQIRSELNEMIDERDIDPDVELRCQLKEAELFRLHESMERRSVAQHCAIATGKTSKVLWWAIRISIRGDLGRFQNAMQRIAKAPWVDKQHGVTYVLEQSGVDASSRGHNPHAHIRLRSSLTAGRIVAKLRRATGFEAAAYEVGVCNNVNAYRQYMLGNKGDPDKDAKCVQDKCWRIEEGLKMEYVIKNA